jgi:hypothetical protein
VDSWRPTHAKLAHKTPSDNPSQNKKGKGKRLGVYSVVAYPDVNAQYHKKKERKKWVG